MVLKFSGRVVSSVGGYGTKRLRDHVHTHGKVEPTMSAMLMTTLNRVNTDHTADRMAWDEERTAWKMKNKVLRVELVKTYCSKMDEAHVAGEALKTEKLAVEEERAAFRKFRATAGDELAETNERLARAEKSLTGTTRRAEGAEGHLAAAKVESAELLKQKDAFRASQATAERHLAGAQQQLAGTDTRARTAEGRLAAAETMVRNQQTTIVNLGKEHEALREQNLRLDNRCTAQTKEYWTVQEAHADVLRQVNAALVAAEARARAAEAQLANASQAMHISAAASTVATPAPSQVAAHLQPTASWVGEIVGRTALPIGEEFLLRHYLHHNRNDKAAIERLIEQVQGEAMRAIPGVQLPSNNVQVLVDGVRAGPAGWKWSSTPAQGLATAQASAAGTGRSVCPPPTASAPVAAPVPALAPAQVPVFGPTPVQASRSAPSFLATSALAPTVTTRAVAPAARAPVAASQGARQAAHKAANQAAFARAMNHLNAGSDRAARQASHAKNAAAATATATAPPPSATAATVTAPNAFAVSLPSAAAAAPVPATLAARAVNGSKSQQANSMGPTSDRSRRKVGP